MSSPSVFTATSAYSLAGVAGIGIVATAAARTLLPKNAPWQDRVAFIWLVRVQTTPFHPDPIFLLGFADDANFVFRYPSEFIWLSTQQPPKTREKKIKNQKSKSKTES